MRIYWREIPGVVRHSNEIGVLLMYNQVDSPLSLSLHTLPPAELDEMLGTELARSLRIVQHDARDAESHADLGCTEGGIPIRIDRFFLESDLRILTGLIEPHLMAGFSGGRKAVCPGLADVETVRIAHGPAMLEGHVGPGIVDGNPLHAGLLEIQRRVGAHFLVNVALDRERRLAAVFGGDVVVFYLVALLPFLGAGFAVSAILSYYAPQVSTLYNADLVGAGIGCVLVVLLLNLVGAPAAISGRAPRLRVGKPASRHAPMPPRRTRTSAPSARRVAAADCET